MKTMHKISNISNIVGSFLFPILLVGCAKEVEQQQSQEELHEVVFHAGWAPETKTVLQEDGSVWWSPGDEIILFAQEGTTSGYKLTSTNAEDSPTTNFVGLMPAATDAHIYYAQYPYNENAFFSREWFYTEIPDVQYATEGNISRNQLISVAISNDTNLYFRNVFGGIKFSVANEGITKISIKTSGLGALRPIAGKLQVNLNDTGLPDWATSAYGQNGEDLGEYAITVYPAEGKCFIPGKFYYITINTGSHSLDVTYHKGNLSATKKMTEANFKRSVFKRLINQDKNLTFTESANSYALIKGNLLPDDIDCTKITEVYFHTLSGVTTDYILEQDSYYDYSPIYFEIQGTSVHYYTSAEKYKIESYAANGMFEGWRNIKTLDLSMFNTEDVNSSDRMFCDCVNLESVNMSSFNTPNLQGMTSMFQNCRNLKSVNLSSFNFNSLFNDSNHVAPCEGLFSRCFSLVNVDLGNMNVRDRQCGFSMKEIARFSKNCAIKCTQATREALSSANAGLENNAEYITWFLPEEDMPEFEPKTDPTLYVSSDYQKDRTVRVLNKAASGNGINVILMGDGYSDRMIADGTYDKDMELAMASIFSKEPYASFRDLFNVYMVYAVSKCEVMEDSPTVFYSSLKEDSYGFYISCDDYLVTDYASVIDTDLLETTILIIRNQQEKNDLIDGVAGVFVYPESSEVSDYGSGGSRAFVNRYDREETALYSRIVSHEFGHAFAKLGDEYGIFSGNIPNERKNTIIEEANKWGYWKNIDFTSDPDHVKWKKFLLDKRYADADLGVFVGGQTYHDGVWHPSQNNIMTNDTSPDAQFNAPSREAIYYRIHKLAYGKDWQYNFEDFVQWDLKNIQNESKTSVQAVPYPARVNERKPFFKMKEIHNNDGREEIRIIMN